MVSFGFLSLQTLLLALSVPFALSSPGGCTGSWESEYPIGTGTPDGKFSATRAGSKLIVVTESASANSLNLLDCPGAYGSGQCVKHDLDALASATGRTLTRPDVIFHAASNTIQVFAMDGSNSDKLAVITCNATSITCDPLHVMPYPIASLTGRAPIGFFDAAGNSMVITDNRNAGGKRNHLLRVNPNGTVEHDVLINTLTDFSKRSNVAANPLGDFYISGNNGDANLWVVHCPMGMTASGDCAAVVVTANADMGDSSRVGYDESNDKLLVAGLNGAMLQVYLCSPTVTGCAMTDVSFGVAQTRPRMFVDNANGNVVLVSRRVSDNHLLVTKCTVALTGCTQTDISTPLTVNDPWPVYDDIAQSLIVLAREIGTNYLLRFSCDDVDECASNPCENGGTCTDLVDGYTCACVPGYNGLTCGVNIDECASNPCENGGTCTDLVDGYTCACVPGYNGLTCGVNVDECASSPCENGGTCTDAVNGHLCTCPPGFAGITCNINVDVALSHLPTATIANGTSASAVVSQLTALLANDTWLAASSTADAVESVTSSLSLLANFSLATSFSLATAQASGNTTLVAELQTVTALGIANATIVLANTLLASSASHQELVGASVPGGPSVATSVEAAARALALGQTCDEVHSDSVGVLQLLTARVSTSANLSGVYSSTATDATITVPTDFSSELASDPSVTETHCSITIEMVVFAPSGSPFPDRKTAAEQLASTYNTSDATLILDSAVMSFVAGVASVANLSESASVIIELAKSGTVLSTMERRCFYWSYVHGGWASDGCEKIAETPTTVTCRCNHLTSFAVLFDAGNTAPPPPPPTVDECESNPCLNGASCLDGVDSFVCVCASGFSGVLCSINVNECTSAPCQNGGACTDGVDSFMCTCANGWTGTTCTGQVNECSSTPCHNGATCVDSVDGFTCTCTAGYSGALCSINDNECASTPCNNGGVCVDSVDGFTCTCASGWTGTTCTLGIDECVSSPCGNGGTCEDAVDGFTCVCAAGFSGSHCFNSTICDSSPCDNGGSCVTTGPAAFTCSCAVGWTGAQCQTVINHCDSTPCHNAGLCTNSASGFSCTCTAGFSGTDCSLDVDECVSMPCQNGAVCEDNVNGFVCTCASGWTGVQCDVNINECASAPCANGGTCVETVDAYTCSCESAWTGPRCITSLNECVSSPCANGGACIDGIGSFTCSCVGLWTGSACEIELEIFELISMALNDTVGGVLTTTNVTLVVPPGALPPGVTTIVIGRPASQGPLDTEPHTHRGSIVYALQPAITFNVPVRITVPTGASSSGYHLVLYYRAAGQPWERAGNQHADKNMRTISGDLSHFSDVVVYYEADNNLLSRITDYVTWISSAMSIVGCILVIVVYAVLRDMRTTPIVFLMQLCVALIMVNVVFLVGIDRTNNPSVCSSMKLLLYYFILVLFSWMFACALHLWRAIAFNVRSTSLATVLIRSCLVWALPAIPTVIVAVIDTLDGNTTSQVVCWFARGPALTWAFLVPLSVLLVASVFVQIACFRFFYLSYRRARSLGKAGVDERVRYLRASVVFTLTTGSTWLFAYIALALDVDVMWLVFALLNGFQGVWLFIAYCMPSRVRHAFAAWYRKRFGDRSTRTTGRTQPTGSAGTKSTSENLAEGTASPSSSHVRAIPLSRSRNTTETSSSSDNSMRLRDILNGRLESFYERDEEVIAEMRSHYRIDRKPSNSTATMSMWVNSDAAASDDVQALLVDSVSSSPQLTPLCSPTSPRYLVAHSSSHNYSLDSLQLNSSSTFASSGELNVNASRDYMCLRPTDGATIERISGGKATGVSVDSETFFQAQF